MKTSGVHHAMDALTAGENPQYCHIFRGDYKWDMDLLIAYIHRSEVQVITALSLFSTLYKSPQHPLSLFPACCVFNSHSLVTASNSGDSSASCAHVITVQ
jgi:hypothetical protein